MSLKDSCLKFLDKAIYWLIILIPFSIAIAPAPTNVFWAMLIVFYLIKKILSQEKILLGAPINKAFGLFIIVSAVSMVNTINYGSSLRGIFKLVQYGLLYIAMVSEIKDRRQINKIIIFMVLGAMLSSIDAFWQIISGRDFIRGNLPVVIIGLRRATAAFPNPNVLGVYLAPLFAISSGLALYYFQGLKKIVFSVLSLVILSAILFAYARPAVLACYIGLFFMAIMKKDKILKRALIVLLIIFPFALPKGAKEWAKTIHYNPIIFMCNHDRISIYKNTVNMIKQHPFLGVGVNTYSINYLKYKLPEPPDAMTGDSMYAHNNFLQVAGETGLVGLGVFLGLIFKIFQELLGVYRKTKDKFYNILTLSLIASLLVFLVNGLTETSLYYKRVSVIFWFIAGLALALRKFADAERAG